MAAMERGLSPHSDVNTNNSSSLNQVQSSSFPSHLNSNLPLKLDQNNFVSWKLQVLPVIRACDLEEFGKKKKSHNTYLEDNSDEYDEEFLQWKKADQLLVCWLLSILTPSVLSQVTYCVTSYEVWKTLEKLYSQQSLTKVMYIRSQLQSTKKRSLSIADYIAKMKTFADALGAAGQPVVERDLAMYILEGLSSEYDPVVVNLTSHPNIAGRVMLQNAQFLLISYKARMEQQSAVASLNTNNAMANYSFSDKIGQRGGNLHFNRGR